MPRKQRTTAKFSAPEPLPRPSSDHPGAPNLQTPMPMIVSREDLPYRLSWFQTQDNGAVKWNEAWNAYIEREYAPRKTWPDTAAILRPWRMGIESDNGARMSKDLRISLFEKQRLDVRNLSQPYGGIGPLNLYQTFSSQWLLMGTAARESLFVEGLVRVCDPESKSEYNRKDCPEITSQYIERDGGNGLLDLFRTLYGDAKNPREPYPEPNLLSHPVVDKLWQVDRPRPPNSDEAYVNVYANYKLLMRTKFICHVLDGIMGAFLGEDHKPKGPPKTLLNLEYLREAKKGGFLTERDKERWRAGTWHCSGCQRTEKHSRDAFLACTACKAVGTTIMYCNRTCQKADWKVHKLVCGKAAKPPSMPQPIRTHSGGDSEFVGSMIPPPDPGFKRSPALLKQITLLKNHGYWYTYYIHGGEHDSWWKNITFFHKPFLPIIFEYYLDIALRNGDPCGVAQLYVAIANGHYTGPELSYARVKEQLCEEYELKLEDLTFWVGAVMGKPDVRRRILLFVTDLDMAQSVD